MIDSRQTLYQLLTETPALADYFAANGLPSDAQDPRARRLTLASALSFKKIDPQRFCCEAELFLTQYASRLREQDAAERVRSACAHSLRRAAADRGGA